jgi:hypothetical protein
MLGELARSLLHISPLLAEPAVGFCGSTSPLSLLAVLFGAIPQLLPCLALVLRLAPEDLCLFPSLFGRINRSPVLRGVT